ncbi:MAG: hypothetical protein K9K66_06870 [Desulfarculaceae bacterium]|nr:hypothetical protein [Desulfarculaceae bacterium]MCF8071812.1 hypothetical protein [Desulfarculaceae bacterium]MCF8101362.1 hypothetical protein [Desulfarculaceae bacterium]MCF8117177.1 hypothetical protein [Desulfarculaceae bacterium]
MSRLILISALCVVALMLFLAGPGCSSEEEHAPAPAAQAQAHDHGHDHEHGEGHLAPAPPDIKRTPEEIERLRQQRVQAMAEADEAYAKMEIDPALAAKHLGFDDNGKVFELGMSLEKAMKAVLAGGNRCRLRSGEAGPDPYKMEIVTKDSRMLCFDIREQGNYLLIERLSMAKLDGGLTVRRHGPKAAFYLMTFMRSL